MALILWHTALLLVFILENPACLHWLCRSSRRSGLCQTSSRSTFGPLCIWRGTLFLNVSRVEMGEITTSNLINLIRAINGSSKAATYSPEVTTSPGTTFLPNLGQQSGKLVSQMWGKKFWHKNRISTFYLPFLWVFLCKPCLTMKRRWLLAREQNLKRFPPSSKISAQVRHPSNLQLAWSVILEQLLRDRQLPTEKLVE